MLMFICVQILQYFSMSLSVKIPLERKNLKNMNVLGTMRLGLRKILSSHEELQDLAFHN